MDFRPLSNEINAWLRSQEGLKRRAEAEAQGGVELLTYRDGGYRAVFVFSGEGITYDFYPVTQPQRKGEAVAVERDSLRLLEKLEEEGDFTPIGTGRQVEAFVKKKLGITIAQ